MKGSVKGFERGSQEGEVFLEGNPLTREDPETGVTTLHPSPFFREVVRVPSQDPAELVDVQRPAELAP